MISAAKILEQRSHLVSGKLRITEHFFEVPRDYANPSLGSIQLFARSALKAEIASTLSPEEEKKQSQRPWLVYLQGGPGFGCRSPQNESWAQILLDKGYQLLLLDQRGTGLSYPISQSSLQLRGDESVQANYLKSFRADSIVKDCEALRKALTADFPEDRKKWSIMGQSFGGYCATTYLSYYPEGLKEAFIFGGLPPMVDQPDKVYEKLYHRVKKRNDQYYEKYPEDVERVKSIVKLLSRFGEHTVRLGEEASLSARRFLQLGISFGMHGGFDAVHELVLRASSDLGQFGHLTRPTTAAIERSQPFDTNVIHALLHEPLYCQGKASNWSADRVHEKFSEFSLQTDGPIYFTGETIYSFMFEHYAELRKLKTVGQILASDADWPRLYDLEQLSKNEVPVYAAVYFDDMYVDFDFSMETASKIKGAKTYITNALYHDAIRSSKMEDVIKAVWAMKEDVID